MLPFLQLDVVKHKNKTLLSPCYAFLIVLILEQKLWQQLYYPLMKRKGFYQSLLYITGKTLKICLHKLFFFSFFQLCHVWLGQRDFVSHFVQYTFELYICGPSLIIKGFRYLIKKTNINATPCDCIVENLVFGFFFFFSVLNWQYVNTVSFVKKSGIQTLLGKYLTGLFKAQTWVLWFIHITSVMHVT